VSQLIMAEKAQSLADEVVSNIRDLVKRIEVAGSLRRRKPMVHDIDIVLIPVEGRICETGFMSAIPVFPTAIAMRLGEAMDAELLKKGEKLLQMRIRDVQVDIYASCPRQWGVHLLRWTGSRRHNIELCKRAQELGLKLAVSEGLKRDDEVVASWSEVEIFEALQLPFREPWERE